MTTEGSTNVFQRQRQRRFHRRSRNGCATCKAKHIRCDERKPLCTFCLRHGGSCQYLTESNSSSTSTPTTQKPVPTNEEPLDPALVGSLAPIHIHDISMDPFVGTQYEMPYKSRPLFYLFASTRVLYRSRVERNQDSFLVHRALSHPGFLHAALLLTTLHWAWHTGDVEQFRVPYLYHKVQAIRFVNEQLQNPENAASDGTIAVVASLAVMENSLGSTEAVSSHLQGLARIKELQDEERRPKKMGLLQRMIAMAARSVSSRPVWDMLNISRTDDVHQSVIISLLRIALRPIYSMPTLSGTEDPEEPLAEVLARKTPHPRTSDIHKIPTQRTVDTSRSEFLACYFYLYMILRENDVDSFLVEWFIEQLLADVCRTEALMQKGQYSQSLWFWTVMFGACAAHATKTYSDAERSHMKMLKDVYLDKINLVSQILKVRNWEGAKSILRLFAWEDNFHGETEVQALWEEAVWGDNGKRPRTKHMDYTIALRPGETGVTT
ncbi:hypothetical protein NPX13_g6455 [Xylaria arbuscula]|uniref:Zn(2)-C6 fungal-type domain-containing protein n=1 Tax=Xylaria arbuscula TaxID=114810 RepID=A0A9W8NCG7_9PEZI|nr:hypothetical protein NPX13_g6455 [Xylaria arbuscula]